MGRRGPKPTPTAILAMRGSWRAKARGGEPQPPAGRPPCPKRLGQEAQRTYRALVKMLDRMGVVSQIDGAPLARYASTLVRWWRLNDDVEANGEITADGLGVRPQAQQLGRLAEQLIKIEKEFGMTPSARASLVSALGIVVPLVSGPKDLEVVRREATKDAFFRRADSGPEEA